jgi:hypothetical protein
LHFQYDVTETAALRHHARLTAAAELLVRRAVDDVLKRLSVASPGGKRRKKAALGSRTGQKRNLKELEGTAAKALDHKINDTEDLAVMTSALALRARNSIEISKERLLRSRSRESIRPSNISLYSFLRWLYYDT